MRPGYEDDMTRREKEELTSMRPGRMRPGYLSAEVRFVLAGRKLQ